MNKYVLVLSIVLLEFMLTSGARANSNTSHAPFIVTESYFIDESGILPTNEVLGQLFLTDIDALNTDIKLLKAHTVYWMQFKLFNPNTKAAASQLVMNGFDKMNIFILENNTLSQIHQGGFLNNRERTYYFSNMEAFDIHVPANDSLTVYVAFSNHFTGFEHLEYYFYTDDQLQNIIYAEYFESKNNLWFQYGFLCILLFQILYLLFQWYYIRRIEYPYYIAYIILTGIYFFSKYEYLLQTHVFFSIYPQWRWYLDRLLPLLSYFFYYRFARAFLDIPRQSPLVNKWIKRVEYILVVYAVADMIFVMLTMNIEMDELAFTFFSILLFITTTILIYIFIKQKNTLGNFIAVGAICITIGSFGSLILFITDDFLPGIDPLFPSQLSILIELIIFTTALAYKARLDEKEKIVFQNKLIEELKVSKNLKENVQSMRDNISRDLHDDMGATLGSITFYSEAAKKVIAKQQPEKSVQLLQKIEETAREMVDQLSDVVWAVNSKNDSMEQLFVRMKTFAFHLLNPSEIDFTFEADEQLNTMHLTMDMRKNIFLIFKEAVYNIAKYSGANHVLIQFIQNEKKISMLIKDNGNGFDQKNITAYNGNGLKNMRKRAEEMQAQFDIASDQGNGTSIVVEFYL